MASWSGSGSPAQVIKTRVGVSLALRISDILISAFGVVSIERIL